MPDKVTILTTGSELIKVPVPSQTKTYKPISHAQLIDLTRESIDKAGFVLDKEVYTKGRDGKQANGKYTISSIQDSEMQLMIGWQNSYDKSISLKFAIGVQIFICTNGALSGDMGTFKKKHWGDIQEYTPTHIVDYISSAGEGFQKIQQDRDKMKEVDVTRRVQAELVGRMLMDDAIINITQLGIIKHEIDNPSFNYGADNSLWELYNHTTHALKESTPHRWMQQQLDVHNFFTNSLL